MRPLPTMSCRTERCDLWANHLARESRQQYPDLFDEDDLRLTVNQPRNHFSAWFAAIHRFYRQGGRL